MHIGQAEMAVLEFEGEFFVVDAQAVKHRRVEIVMLLLFSNRL